MVHTITAHSVSTAPLPQPANKSVVKLIPFTNYLNAAHARDVLLYGHLSIHVIKLQICQDVSICHIFTETQCCCYQDYDFPVTSDTLYYIIYTT